MDNQKKITIYDVASKANVAISTVSRVLNESPYVSERTRNNVLKAIKELDFRPQVSARKLASKEPQIVAIAVPSFTTPFFNEVLKGVKDEIQKIDLDLVIYNTGSKNPVQGFKDFLDRGSADTMIIFSIDIDEEIHKRLQNSKVPTILVGTSHADYDYIDIDNYKGGYIAGQHLGDQGFKKIGIIKPAYDTKSGFTRVQGLKDALSEYNIKVDDELIMTGTSEKHAGFTEEAGFEAIYEFHKKGNIPEVIFCTNDTQAIGALNALNKLGIHVPDDIAIMGYDNIKLSKYLELTSIDQKMYSIGATAMEQLSNLINNKEAKRLQKIITPTLVARNSTKNMKLSRD